MYSPHNPEPRFLSTAVFSVQSVAKTEVGAIDLTVICDSVLLVD